MKHLKYIGVFFVLFLLTATVVSADSIVIESYGVKGKDVFLCARNTENTDLTDVPWSIHVKKVFGRLDFLSEGTIPIPAYQSVEISTSLRGFGFYDVTITIGDDSVHFRCIVILWLVICIG